MTVKDLEDEYALYTIEDEETYTEEEIREYAEYLYECLEDDREVLSEDLKANKKFVIKTRIMDFLNGYDSGIINIINEDNELLRTEWSLLTMFQGYFRTLYEVVHSESISEGYKLICYCAKNYQDNMDYIEDIRDDLDAAMSKRGFWRLSQYMDIHLEDLMEDILWMCFRSFLIKSLVD